MLAELRQQLPTFGDYVAEHAQRMVTVPAHRSRNPVDRTYYTVSQWMFKDVQHGRPRDRYKLREAMEHAENLLAYYGSEGAVYVSDAVGMPSLVLTADGWRRDRLGPKASYEDAVARREERIAKESNYWLRLTLAIFAVQAVVIFFLWLWVW